MYYGCIYHAYKSFFYKLSNVFHKDYRLAKKSFLLNMGDWTKKFDQLVPYMMCWVIWFSDNSSTPSKMKNNDWYNTQKRIVVFLRNYCIHNYILVDPFNLIELIFFGITGRTFNEMATKVYSWGIYDILTHL